MSCWRAASASGAIADQAQKLAGAESLALVEDDALVEENAGLAEWPVVLAGTFDESFLEVPQEVLITSMKAHQKCFSLRQPSSGALANRFLMVANQQAQDGGKAIIAGNERVIRARLSDAKFFWDNDRKRSLDVMLPMLDQITFHEKLGTQGERVKRLMRLARELAPLVGADPDKAERAAQLCKADLVSETVGEFPELQGVIGRYIALEQGEDAEVAAAIAEHYKPAGQSDSVPTSRFPSLRRWLTSSICSSASGPSTKSRPAQRTLMDCAARHSASCGQSWRTNCDSLSKSLDCYRP